jgi:osmotically-inducible protein OsmY
MLQYVAGMTRQPGRNPKTYDEIVRETVLDPDSSKRPTPEQVRAAHEGFRALDAGEQSLQGQVLAALARSGADVSKVTTEVSDELVTLRGQVPDAAMLRAIEDAVARIPGVATIHNQVVVGS